jgi:glutathione S-transferase
MSALPRLTYFSSRGRAELIRLVLAEAEVEYIELNVGVYDPVTAPAAFAELRATGVLAFDALPLWEEADGFRLVQSDAIVRHVARSHGRYGANARDAARCDQFLAGIEDTRLDLRKLFSVAPDARAALRDELATSIVPRWLGRLERLLAPDGFVLGAQPSLADVALWFLLETLRDNRLNQGLVAHPRLAALGELVGDRPGIAAYRASPTRFPPQLLPA